MLMLRFLELKCLKCVCEAFREAKDFPNNDAKPASASEFGKVWRVKQMWKIGYFPLKIQR